MEPASRAPLFTFNLKHRWALKNHFMTGITLRPWLSILWEHAANIDWRWYWHRVLFLTAMAALNSCFATIDRLLYGRRCAAQQLHEQPVFILGHPRTGTTHLHNMFALDDRFAYASVFQAGFPSSFLSMECFKPLLSPVLDSRRPMDNMAISFDSPAEDEIATNVLSGGISPYMPILLMRSHQRFSRYYTFQEVSPAELQAWRDSFMGFLKKVTYSHGGSKPLLIKSPVHTARVRLLLKLFPAAKFIYIHRHPVQVFQSAAHMANTYYWYTYLQLPSDKEINEFIFEQGLLLHHSYLADRHLVPAGNLVELSFEQLDSDPLGTMQSVYQRLSLPGFERVRPVMEQYIGSLADFKKNDHRRLPADLEALVRERWADLLNDFNYT